MAYRSIILNGVISYLKIKQKKMKTDYENDLKFGTLTAANRVRIPLFKDANGNVCHSKPDGSDWSLGEWVCAVTGEVGELANIVKKVKRGDFTLDEKVGEMADEAADIVIYLDILCQNAGIDLGSAVKRKFNAVSDRIGVDVFIK